MLTLFVILALAATILTIYSMVKQPANVPLSVAVLLLCIIECLQALPLGK